MTVRSLAIRLTISTTDSASTDEAWVQAPTQRQAAIAMGPAGAALTPDIISLASTGRPASTRRLANTQASTDGDLVNRVTAAVMSSPSEMSMSPNVSSLSFLSTTPDPVVRTSAIRAVRLATESPFIDF